ncbi:hypothetical protein [Burkholderia ubonensis]|uniref:hypothetical protein n=1 Tax=Burkholderia ubonensis TaxID=101571 RepID=UPI0007550A1B|nr:hypothetical protein [Burkholderia ubonensis]KVP39891.1 hypothetical protein WJ87_06825 [Burkholderia ubonensis]
MTWLAVIATVLWLLAEVIRAVVVSASWLRFTWKAARARGTPVFPAIFKLPFLLATSWVEFLGYSKGSMTFRETNGVWKGFGDWTVYPPQPKSQEDHVAHDAGHAD